MKCPLCGYEKSCRCTKEMLKQRILVLQGFVQQYQDQLFSIKKECNLFPTNGAYDEFHGNSKGAT